MNCHVVLLVLVLVLVSCSSSGVDAPDLGPGPGPGQAEDLGVADAAMPAPPFRLVAGALGGPGSVDGTAADARFNGPHGIAVDGAGNLLVADTNNGIIRKVETATGAVTTLAGTAFTEGSADGIGAAVGFTGPRGVAFDGTGILWIADSGGHAIRKLEIATGVVTTLAGSLGIPGTSDGTGAAARFANPYDVASDGAGNLFVADSSNHTLRKVVIATGEVTTIAGTAGMAGSSDGSRTAARLNGPWAVAADSAGNVYFTEMYGNAVRKLVIATGEVSTLAGSASQAGSTDGVGTAARFSQPRGVTLDGAGNLFVSDGRIRKVVLASATVTTLVGSPNTIGSSDGTGAAAQFHSPWGTAVDSAGNLWVADNSNHLIRKVVIQSGVVTTLAGSRAVVGTTDGIGADARFSYPQGLAIDSRGNCYVADTNNNTIRKVVIGSGEVTTLVGLPGVSGTKDGIGTDARFSNPRAVALDDAGNLFVADTLNHTIRKVVIATRTVTTVAGTARLFGYSDGIGAAAQFRSPHGVAVDNAGNLFIADYANQLIRKVVISTGEVTTLAGTVGLSGSSDGTADSARFNFPRHVAVDNAGNLYVTDTGNHTIRKLVIATAVVTTLAGTAGLRGNTDGSSARFRAPSGLAIDGMGNLLVADSFNGTIRRIALSNAVVTTILGVAGTYSAKPGPLPGRLNQPLGVAVSPSGEIVVSEGAENAIFAAR